jgi:hypothetical protein
MAMRRSKQPGRGRSATIRSALSPRSRHGTDKKVEAASFDDVILYFNVGLKPHAQVKDEMGRFVEEVMPAFQ